MKKGVASGQILIEVSIVMIEVFGISMMHEISTIIIQITAIKIRFTTSMMIILPLLVTTTLIINNCNHYRNTIVIIKDISWRMTCSRHLAQKTGFCQTEDDLRGGAVGYFHIYLWSTASALPLNEDIWGNLQNMRSISSLFLLSCNSLSHVLTSAENLG